METKIKTLQPVKYQYVLKYNVLNSRCLKNQMSVIFSGFLVFLVIQNIISNIFFIKQTEKGSFQKKKKKKNKTAKDSDSRVGDWPYKK